MSDYDVDAEAVEVFACPFCGQPPGVGCTTRGGNRSRWPHEGRSRPLRHAWMGGYDDGWTGALHLAKDSPAHFGRLVARSQ
jgi:hypothetical protein